MVTYAAQRKAAPALRKIGTWATWWWGISWAYLLLLAWKSRNFYANTGANFSFKSWMSAMHQAFAASAMLRITLAAIALIWVAGGWLWLRELKRQKISYKTAFKDMFLTIRK